MTHTVKLMKNGTSVGEIYRRSPPDEYPGNTFIFGIAPDGSGHMIAPYIEETSISDSAMIDVSSWPKEWIDAVYGRTYD